MENMATAARPKRTCGSGMVRRRIQAILERRCPGNRSDETFPVKAPQLVLVPIVVMRARPDETTAIRPRSDLARRQEVADSASLWRFAKVSSKALNDLAICGFSVFHPASNSPVDCAY